MFYECAKKEQKALESSKLDDVTYYWLKFIKNPESYLKRKIKIIQRDKFFKKKKISV